MKPYHRDYHISLQETYSIDAANLSANLYNWTRKLEYEMRHCFPGSMYSLRIQSITPQEGSLAICLRLMLLLNPDYLFGQDLDVRAERFFAQYEELFTDEREWKEYPNMRWILTLSTVNCQLSIDKGVSAC